MNQIARIPTRKPALRLVSTKDLSRDAWLEYRKQGIGASEAAAACGISPYMSPLELWMIKTGRDGDMPKVDPNDEESPMYWGNILEPIVAEHYTKRTGNKVRRKRSILQHPDVDKAFMLANLDYIVVSCTEAQILECKTAGEWGAKHWRNGVPDYVQCQVQHQLAITGFQAADVGVLICGQKFHVFRIDRDEDVIASIIERERQFWHYVETDTPPPADGSESAGKALGYLYPTDSGQVIDLSENEVISNYFTELKGAREEISLLEDYEAKLKQRIQESMAEHTKAIFPTGEATWKAGKNGTRRFTVKFN